MIFHILTVRCDNPILFRTAGYDTSNIAVPRIKQGIVLLKLAATLPVTSKISFKYSENSVNL